MEKKKCIKCGKFPFCNKIEDSQQEGCEEFIKRSLDMEVMKGQAGNEQNNNL